MLRRVYNILNSLLARLKCARSNRGKQSDKIVGTDYRAVINSNLIDAVSEGAIPREDDKFNESFVQTSSISTSLSELNEHGIKHRNPEKLLAVIVNDDTKKQNQRSVDHQTSTLDTITHIVAYELTSLERSCQTEAAFTEILNLLMLSNKSGKEACIRDHFLSLFGPFAVLRVMKHASYQDNEEIQRCGCSILRMSFQYVDSDSIIRKWNVAPDNSILADLNCIDECMWAIIYYMQKYSLSTLEQADGCSALYSFMRHYWLLALRAQYRGIKTEEFPSSEMDALLITMKALKEFTFDPDILNLAIDIIWFTMRHGHNKDQLIECGTIPLLGMILHESNQPFDESRLCDDLPVETERRLRLTINCLEHIERHRYCLPSVEVSTSNGRRLTYETDLFSDDFTVF
jgi:hypothetical protein